MCSGLVARSTPSSAPGDVSIKCLLVQRTCPHAIQGRPARNGPGGSRRGGRKAREPFKADARSKPPFPSTGGRVKASFREWSLTSVDVVVPCYNYARFLQECVGSVLSQDGVDVRVLIIDDASIDD